MLFAAEAVHAIRLILKGAGGQALAPGWRARGTVWTQEGKALGLGAKFCAWSLAMAVAAKRAEANAAKAHPGTGACLAFSKSKNCKWCKMHSKPIWFFQLLIRPIL